MRKEGREKNSNKPRDVPHCDANRVKTCLFGTKAFVVLVKVLLITSLNEVVWKKKQDELTSYKCQAMLDRLTKLW